MKQLFVYLLDEARSIVTLLIMMICVNRLCSMSTEFRECSNRLKMPNSRRVVSHHKVHCCNCHCLYCHMHHQWRSFRHLHRV